jgi:ABC-type transport system substrate-binding protein
MVAQWSQLGIAVRSEAVSPDVLADRLASGQFDAALAELTFEPYVDPDPYVFWHQGQYQVGQNFGGVNDRRTSELLEQARRDANGLHRDEYYADFQRTFVNRSLAIVLYYPVYEYAVRSHVEGVQVGYLSTSSDRFRGIKDWRLSE